jgi:hypothetical protein
MKPMKIGLLGPTYPYRGGISHYTTLLFKHLKLAHSVKFISFKRQYPAILFPGKTDKDSSSAPLIKDPELRERCSPLTPEKRSRNITGPMLLKRLCVYTPSAAELI